MAITETNDDIKTDIIKACNLSCGEGCVCAREFAESLSISQVLLLARLARAKKPGVKRLGKVGWVERGSPRHNCPVMPVDEIAMLGKQTVTCG